MRDEPGAQWHQSVVARGTVVYQVGAAASVSAYATVSATARPTLCVGVLQMTEHPDRTPEERSAIMQFSTYWRQQAHAPYLMSRPEVQVVLVALAETAYM